MHACIEGRDRAGDRGVAGTLEAGEVQPGAEAGPAIWTLYFVFTGLCTWLYLSSLKRPGDTPITRAVSALDAGVHRIRDLFAQEPQGATS